MGNGNSGIAVDYIDSIMTSTQAFVASLLNNEFSKGLTEVPKNTMMAQNTINNKNNTPGQNMS